MTDRHRLIVMRHAKAEPFGSSDHARPLTDKGLSAARDTGLRLRDIGVLPDFAVVSSAVRTRETWDALAEAAGIEGCQVSFDDTVFAGSPDVVLEALRAAPADAGTVLLIGHNPTASYLCHLLDDGDGDPTAILGLLGGFPPSALAVLDVSVPWAELGPGVGRVTDFYVGRVPGQA